MSKRKARRNRPSNLRPIIQKPDSAPAGEGEQAKVMIATPMGDTCLAPFHRSVVVCVAHSIASGLAVAHDVAQYSILHHSRNKLVERAIEHGSTHVLFIDSDMEFPADTAIRLAQHRKAIVGANCMARRRPYYLTARDSEGYEIPTFPDSTGLERCHLVGTGLLMIHVDVFKAMPEPWFEFGWNPETKTPRGEDFMFLEKAQQLGFEAYIDHDLSKQVNHIGMFAYNPLLRAGFNEVESQMVAAEGKTNG